MQDIGDSLKLYKLKSVAEEIFVGKGTKEKPYLISSEVDLILLSEQVAEGEKFYGKYFLQTADIEMTQDNFRPIGEFGTENAFCGIYDGNGHRLNNLHIHGGNVALFGQLGGTVMNLGIESGVIEGACCGSIASHAYGSKAKIVNCYNKATIKGYRAGGIADNFNGDVIGCWTDCQLEGNEIGSIVSYDGRVSHCYTKNLTEKDKEIGVKVFSSEIELKNMMNKNLIKRTIMYSIFYKTLIVCPVLILCIISFILLNINKISLKD